jgi:serine protease Do
MDEGQFAGIGLAIPIDMILPVVTQLIETGHVEKGFMGVDPMDLTAIIAQQLGYNGQGVFILKVHAGGPARAAGVRTNDIVTHVGGRTVSTVQQLRSLVSSVRPGETVQLTIWRFNSLKNIGETLQVDVNLTSFDDLMSDRGIAVPQRSRDAVPELGIARMATNTRELSEQYEFAEYFPGVIILGLLPSSFLAQQIEPGAVIVDVMDQPISNVDDLFAAIENFNFHGFAGLRAVAMTPDGRRVTLRLRAE